MPETKEATACPSARVADALGLMRHVWVREDPENGDIFCRFCRVQDSSEGCWVGFGPCPKKPVPPPSELRRKIEVLQTSAWKKLIKLAELVEMLDG